MAEPGRVSTSKHFMTLVDGLNQLKEHLLPKDLSNAGIVQYTEAQLSQTLAYRVLAHAEIEQYLEDRVLDAAKTAMREWKHEGKPSRVLLGLVTFCGLEMESPPQTLEPIDPAQRKKWPEKLELDKRINRANEAFITAVARNHGIREANILSLLLPIGFRSSDLDPVWLATMDTFGQQRGEAAHKGALSIKANQSLDPAEELRRIEREILDELKRIDEKINVLLSE